MGESTFSQTMNRSRQDWLEREAALVALDLLKAYHSEEQQVERALIEAGEAFYAKENWLCNGYKQYIADQARRSLRRANAHDGAWRPEPGIVEAAIQSVEVKERATVGEIAEEIVALCTRFEDLGYHRTLIARALGRVGLAVSPVWLIQEMERSMQSRLDFWEENGRAFLDDALGEDRYPGNRNPDPGCLLTSSFPVQHGRPLFRLPAVVR